MILNRISNEYYYKVLFLFAGILYYVYDFMPIVDNFLNLLLVISFIPAIAVFHRGGLSNNVLLFFIISGFGLITVLINDDSLVTMILWYYIGMSVFFLLGCDKTKDESTLKKELDKIATVFVLMSVVIVLISLMTYFLGVSVDYEHPEISNTQYHLGIDTTTNALVGIMSNANSMSSFLVQCMGFTLYLISRNKWKHFLMVFLMIVIATLFLTQSRGGLVGGMIVILFYSFFKIREKLYDVNTRKLLYICCIVGVLILAVLLANGIGVGNLTSKKESSMEGSNAARIELWKAGIKVECSDPVSFVFGTGGNIRDEIGKYVSGSIPSKLYGNMHNVYMQTFVTFGFVGLAILLVLIYLYVIKSTSVILTFPKRYYDLVPLIGMLIGLAVISLVESDIYLNKTFLSSTFWVICGYVYSIIRKRNLKES